MSLLALHSIKSNEQSAFGVRIDAHVHVVDHLVTKGVQMTASAGTVAHVDVSAERGRPHRIELAAMITHGRDHVRGTSGGSSGKNLDFVAVSECNRAAERTA